MRNQFENKESNEQRFGFESKYSSDSHESSPDQIAIVWNSMGEAVAASPASGDTPGSFDMDITRLPAEFNLSAALNMRRVNHLDIPPLSEKTHYLTVVPNFAERTRVLALEGKTLALTDDQLSEWLIEAERQMYLGTDNHPFFETALEDTACTIRRLPNGQVAMTEVPRQFIEATRQRIQQLTGKPNFPNVNLTVETPLRCVARYFLTALPEGSIALRPEKESEVIAFLLIGKSGFNYGLWSPMTGLFSEYAFLAPTEINQQSGNFYEGIGEKMTREVRIIDQKTETPEIAVSPDQENLKAYIKHAFEQLFLQLSQEKLEQFQLSGYSKIVWATEIGLTEAVSAIATEYAERTGYDLFQINIPVDEAVAGGLLFGSFNFGDDTVAGAEILPTVNMERDLLGLADSEELERRKLEEKYLQKRRNRAVLMLVAMPVIVVACLLALVADLVRSQVMLIFREQRADARTVELKPALDRRNSYETNLKWYQEFIKQVSSLRRQQPVGIGLLYELNQNYPFSIDPAFYISDLKLLPNSGVEIKGLARNKDAITSFLRTLEFAGGPGSGTKLFSNLTYEVQEGVAPSVLPPNGQNNLPAMTGSNLGASKPAPGIIAWSIKGNYLPMAEFVPPDPAKKAAVIPPAATNPPGAPNQSNTAPNNQPPANVARPNP